MHVITYDLRFKLQQLLSELVKQISTIIDELDTARKSEWACFWSCDF